MGGSEYAAPGKKARKFLRRALAWAWFERVFTGKARRIAAGAAKRFARDARAAWLAPTAVNLRRVVIIVYILVFFAVSAVFGVSLWQTRAEYLQLCAQEAVSRRRLAEAEQRLREQDQILARLRTDPAYVERVIRQQLGYARPDEFIFRFEP
jgi:cell division protein DivIC